MKGNKIFAMILLALMVSAPALWAQTYVQAWGNIEGLRIEGQLFSVQSNLCLVYNDWQDIIRTAKEQQRPVFERDGDTQTITTSVDNMNMIERITDTESGKAHVELEFKSLNDTTMTGAYVRFDPGAYTEIKFVGSKPSVKAMSLNPAKFKKSEIRTMVKGLQFSTPDQKLQVTLEKPVEVIVRKQTMNGNDSLRVYLAVMTGDVTRDQQAGLSYDITVSGKIDHSPVNLVLDTHNPGRVFDGYGGNFRLQYPDLDSTVVFYNLDNMRVAWGRVQLSLWFWQPEEDMDPIAAADSGNLAPSVYNEMSLARELVRKGIDHIIVSCWFPPQWAIEGEFTWRRKPGDPYGNPLNQAKIDKIYKSIGDYLVYMKDHFGVEAEAFSFNESDLGINVRQTAEEHRTLIKTLGAYLASRGLATKILLGDNSDATTTDFIVPALNDPECFPYIAAVSFHSWRGWGDDLLNFWSDAATKLNVPLIVGEGSTDAAAHQYPQMFLENIFALDEINLYTRIMAICQPKSIVQWQLTSDYSILTGAGIYRTEGPLETTRRFWNMKQLASTPPHAFNLPITTDNPVVNSAALGNIATGEYVVHMVNNGAERPIILTGLPAGMTQLRIYVTDDTKRMQEGPSVPVMDGKAEFTLAAAGFTSAFGNVEQPLKFKPIPRRFGPRRRTE